MRISLAASLLIMLVFSGITLMNTNGVDAAYTPAPGHLLIVNNLSLNSNGECEGDVSTTYSANPIDYSSAVIYETGPLCSVTPVWSWAEPVEVVSERRVVGGLKTSDNGHFNYYTARSDWVSSNSCPPEHLLDQQLTLNHHGYYIEHSSLYTSGCWSYVDHHWYNDAYGYPLHAWSYTFGTGTELGSYVCNLPHFPNTERMCSNSDDALVLDGSGFVEDDRQTLTSVAAGSSAVFAILPPQ